MIEWFHRVSKSFVATILMDGVFALIFYRLGL